MLKKNNLFLEIKTTLKRNKKIHLEYFRGYLFKGWGRQRKEARVNVPCYINLSLGPYKHF